MGAAQPLGAEDPRAQAVRHRHAHVAQEVRARASEHGLDGAAIDALLERGRTHAGVGEDGAGAEREVGDRLGGPGGLTEKANTFAARDVLREYAAAAAQGARLDEVRARGARFADRGDVDTVAGGLTSEALVAAERRLIAAAVGRAGEVSAVVGAAVLERALAGADRPLTDEQAGAVRAVATSGNGVDVIEALAGTGKTFILHSLVGNTFSPCAGGPGRTLTPMNRSVRITTSDGAVWAMDVHIETVEDPDSHAFVELVSHQIDEGSALKAAPQDGGPERWVVFNRDHVTRVEQALAAV